MTAYARAHLGRPLTAIEEAAAAEDDRIVEHRRELHRLWLAEQSPKSLRLMGIVKQEMQS